MTTEVILKEFVGTSPIAYSAVVQVICRLKLRAGAQ